jgi:hypothetical protein
MGSSSGDSVGEKVVSGLCFPVYQAVNKFNEGDTFGGVSTLACPVGVGAGAEAIKAAAEGDYRKAAGKVGQFALEPFGFGAGSGGYDAGTGIYDFATANNSDGDEPETDSAKDVQDAELEEAETAEEARDVTNQEYNTARKAAYQAAINAGATPAQAQASADAQTPIGNAAGNFLNLMGLRNQQIANLREKLGYADALGREYRNLQKSKGSQVANAALQGGSAGASAGMSLFGNS